jgi:hypothetical protein
VYGNRRTSLLKTDNFCLGSTGAHGIILGNFDNETSWLEIDAFFRLIYLKMWAEHICSSSVQPPHRNISASFFFSSVAVEYAVALYLLFDRFFHKLSTVFRTQLMRLADPVADLPFQKQNALSFLHQVSLF